MSTATPHEISQYERARYRRDPDYRLKRINHTRSLRGRPQVSSLDEIKPRGEFRNAR